MMNKTMYVFISKKMEQKENVSHVSQTYRKMTQLEHVYELPDSYVGSVDKQFLTTYIYNSEDENITKRNIEYVPGLYKVYDEIIVNVLDQYVRLLRANSKNAVTTIQIEIDQGKNEISVYNNGQGIDIVYLEEYKCYAPDLIFGQLLTSSNYDKNEKKVTGGKNGFGAKLTNIFSTEFIVETVDHVRKLLYSQKYTDNMKKKEEPVITVYKKEPYTKVTFKPDLKRFSLTHLTDDIVSLMKKRVFDIGAWTKSSVSVVFNKVKIPISNFKSYSSLYIGNERQRVHRRFNENWEVIATYNTDEIFEQVSFVNGINTIRGGKHVEYISNQICRQLAELISKKHKIQIKPVYVKNQLFLFIKATIVNPSFDGQTKETLTTPVSKFGCDCQIDSKFIQELMKTSIVDRIVQQAEYKNNNALKKTDGKKVRSVKGIPKLSDANKAGGSQAQKCTLILTEGDSAKTMAIAGLSEVGRDFYGVFPLKGKVLNVKDADANKLAKNAEITNIKKILGLKMGETYNGSQTPWPLRYGKIMIMTDQDVDGTHIKGLIMNVFHSHWLSLLQMGFVTSLITPIIKVTKGKKEKSFYTLEDYEQWKEKKKGDVKWKVKYYKGLGTSTTKEAKEYFKSMKIVNYNWNSQKSNNALDLAFNKSRADDRKSWLQGYDKTDILDSNEKNVTFDEFIHKDLIHFSNYNVQRAIPSMIDGLKPSQRKVLYGCFKRNLVKEIRVAQLSGYVSEHAAYHHGETSLQDTIIGLAQNFVGTNNINYLLPNGTFGSRLQGGKDSASPRYIYTCLNPITKFIFRPEDEPILNYLDDDGLAIEPDYYLPIIPTVLLNGIKGIGTGYSTTIPAFNPTTLITNMKRIIESRDLEELVPWYSKFSGTIMKTDENTFMSKGKFKLVNSTTIRVTELPIGVWTEKYLEFLESVCIDAKNAKKKQFIQKFIDQSTDSTVCIDIVMHYRVLLGLRQKESTSEYFSPIDEKLHLTKNILLSNMHVFNQHHHVKKFKTAKTIMEEFYEMRIVKYSDRKEHWLTVYKYDLSKIENKVRFISEILNDTLDLRRKKQKEIETILEDKKYERFVATKNTNPNYDYLVKLPLNTLTTEMVEKLNMELKTKKETYETLLDMPVKKIWLDELRELYTEYKKITKREEKEEKEDKKK